MVGDRSRMPPGVPSPSACIGAGSKLAVWQGVGIGSTIGLWSPCGVWQLQLPSLAEQLRAVRRFLQRLAAPPGWPAFAFSRSALCFTSSASSWALRLTACSIDASISGMRARSDAVESLSSPSFVSQ